MDTFFFFKIALHSVYFIRLDKKLGKREKERAIVSTHNVTSFHIHLYVFL